jgi:predicted alpha/beta-hydrolase family hydrolase
MKARLLITILFLFGSVAFAVGETKKIITPRGSELEVTVHAASTANSPTIIIAPGQSCNSKGPLFETLGNKGPLANFTVVRFEWAYCLKDPTKPIPSADLKNEIEDYLTVLSYAKTLPSVDANKILISGKSLGSVVAYSVFKSTPAAKALILLTPICSYTTDENGKPLPEPMQVCDESYPEMKKDSRPIIMTMGDQDSLCILNVLFSYLKDSSGNIQVSVAGGDHGFRLKNSDGTLDNQRTARNIDTVIGNILNWADLKMNP